MSKIVIVGLGGIGSWLVEPLMRYCVSMDRTRFDFVFIDGDHYSLSNQTRQSVHPKLTGMNKASAAALRMRQYFPTVEITEVPEFLTKENLDIIDHNNDNLYVFNCCDNNYCRKIIAQHMESKFQHVSAGVYLFTGGNEVTDGNSHVTKFGYRDPTQDVITAHPEIGAADASEDRGAMSCQQLANMPGSQQIVVTNFWVAAVMLQQFYLIMNSKPIQETFFDISTSAINAIRPAR